MKLPLSEPHPASTQRADASKKIRDQATEIARIQPQALSRANGEEVDLGDSYPANFTKGLLHDDDGLLAVGEDYACFVEAINSRDNTLFEKQVPTAETHGVEFACATVKTCDGEKEVVWRGWESPRSGHVYDLQGPDSGAVGMAPAPRVGSSELSAEMAEVYALALLRDVPFTTITSGGDEQLCGSPKESGKALMSAKEIVRELNSMAFFSGKDVVSSTPGFTDASGLNHFERNRRFARTQSLDGKLTTANVFRGSTPGSLAGPYLSQFMLIGTNSLAGAGGGAASYPKLESSFDLQDGFIPYGSLVIDQRTLSQKNCLDYMTDWCSWLDVQNGANLKGCDQFEEKRRFITTPRDLATYVHFDALYEAYLNAALIMLAMGVPHSKGFPEPSSSRRRDAFATFGGPHILSLVTEVATRCLKAVRRQKFNYHRRARPEALGGRFTLVELGLQEKLGAAAGAFEDSHGHIPEAIRQAIIEHNAAQNKTNSASRGLTYRKNACLPPEVKPAAFAKANLLLPMAFPEGSPMHPAYGAGHATVAGGCVTMLKAFFEMFENNSNRERKLETSDGKPIAYVPNGDGSKLVKSRGAQALTVQGELDKLAANISIGRNMAGVHYYSDYYDSLRMGERVAVGILLQQTPTYDETVEVTFTSFDGDLITISGEGHSAATLSILSRAGTPVSPADWWLRHVSGQAVAEDLM